MHKAIGEIQNALAYARFPHKGFRQTLNEYLKFLGEDLADVDYEMDEDTVGVQMEELQKAMNEIDSNKQETREAIDSRDDYLDDKDVDTDT